MSWDISIAAMKLTLVLTLCLLSSSAAQKTPPKKGASSGRVQTDCTCAGGIMDCASRGKRTFTRNERCSNSISKLLLFNNSIPTLPRDAFASMATLTSLYLQENGLRELPRDVFSDLANLDTLLLHSNQLSNLPEGVFRNLNNLQYISLWGNNFTNIPNRLFAGLRKLIGMSLSDNQLTTLPVDTFSGITEMDVVDLSRNKITHLPRGLFRDIQSIRFLDLSGNQLTQISSQDLTGIRRLFRLDVTGNRITTLPRYDANWPDITFSFFGANDIKRTSEQVIRSWLGNGNSSRYLATDGPTSSEIFFPPEDLKWIMLDNDLQKQLAPIDCRCGKITLRKAAVMFCVRVECGSGRPFSDWMSALSHMSENRPQGGRNSQRGRPGTTQGNSKG